MPTELHIRKRVFALLMMLTLLFSLLTLRIAYLTTARSSELTQRGISQWTREGTVYARRGSILDTNGQTLVVSATAYIVSADPRKVSDISLFTQTVCPILDLSEESVAQKLSDRTKASVILKRQVSREKADELRTLQASADEAVASQLSALLFDEDVRRAYPRGAFLTQTLGLTNVDSVGQSGLELQYESLLRGTAGVSLRSVDGKSHLRQRQPLHRAPGWQQHQAHHRRYHSGDLRKGHARMLRRQQGAGRTSHRHGPLHRRDSGHVLQAGLRPE